MKIGKADQCGVRKQYIPGVIYVIAVGHHSQQVGQRVVGPLSAVAPSGGGGDGDHADDVLMNY